MKLIYIKSITLLIFTLISFSGFAQEDCTNGIDDDGDGLIDLNDDDCVCKGWVTESIFYDFEEMTSCPSSASIAVQNEPINFLANGWVTVTGSPDYNNLCMFPGIGNWYFSSLPPTPFPSGDGCIGFGSSWWWGSVEAPGVCLPNPIPTGVDVTVNFEVGFVNTSFSPVQMSIFTNNDCNTLTFGCPSLFGWIEESQVPVNGPTLNEWSSASTTFTTSASMDMLSITSCNGTSSGYFLLDDVEIISRQYKDLKTKDINLSGDCISGYTLSLNEPSATSYQWYLEGVAIHNATQKTYKPETPYQLGNYRVMAIFNDHCAISDPLLFEPELAKLSVIALIKDVSCYQSNDGKISILQNFKNQPTSYNWSSGQTTSIIDSLFAMIYSITVTDSNGCTGTNEFILYDPYAIEGTIINVVQPTASMPNGSATVKAEGGTPNYTYLWDNGEKTATASQLLPGIHKVTITDSRGCTKTKQVLINAVLNVSSDLKQAGCYNECNGNISVSVSGGTTPYKYLWSRGDTISILNNACAGNYQLTITDNLGSTAIQSFSISSYPAIMLKDTIIGSLCHNSSVATIDLTATGGTGPLKFKWSNDSINEDLIDIAIDTYTVVVTDSLGCKNRKEIIMQKHPEIVFTNTIAMPDCGNANNGAIDLVFNSGAKPFTFLWNNGKTEEDIDGLTAGIYDVIITDTFGCKIQKQIILNQNTDISVLSKIYSPTCHNFNNGEIEVQINGGKSPYTIDWVGINEDSLKLENLTSGTYTLIITDADNCIKNEVITLTNPDTIHVTSIVKEITCPGKNDGSINLNFFAKQPKSIVWSNGMTSSDINNLVPGKYSTSLTDEAGCIQSYEFKINKKDSLAYSISTIDIDCTNNPSGTIKVESTDAQNIIWKDNDTNFERYNLNAGDYEFTLTDGNGCKYTENVKIKDKRRIDNEYISTKSCDINNAGIVTYNLKNSLGCDSTVTIETKYIESDTTHLIDKTCNPIEAGTTSILLVNSQGCDSLIITETILIPSSLVKINKLTCFSNLVGIDTIQLTNILGCDSLVITETSLRTNCNIAFTIPDIVASCVDNVANVTASFPTNIIYPLKVEIKDEQNNSIKNTTINSNIFAEKLPKGKYTLSIVDVEGYNGSASFVVTEPEKPVITFKQSSYNGYGVDCFNAKNGSVSSTVNLGSMPYQYKWSTGEVTSSISNLGAGEYTIIVTDANQCTQIESTTITQPSLLTITLESIEPNCENKNGEISVIPSGGTASYQFSVNNSAFANSSNFSNLIFGKYIVTAIDKNGCEIKDSVEFKEPLPLDISLGDDKTILYSQSIYIKANSNYAQELLQSINWTSGNVPCINCLDQTVQPDSTQTFEVIVVSKNGCRDIDQLVVYVIKEEPITYPNIFNPYAQSENNKFKIVGKSIIKINDISLFDRWGNVVFTAKNISPDQFEWNGTVNGKPVEQGVYLFQASLLLKNQAIKNIIGDVTIMR